MTGLYPTRVGATGAFGPLSDTGMSLDAITMANVLQKAGYASLAVGKWHLGDLPQYAPTQRGFDEFFGVPYSVDMDPLPLLHNSTIVEKEADRDTLTQQYTKKAVEFLNQPREKPFFLYLAHSPIRIFHCTRPHPSEANQIWGCTAMWSRRSIGVSARFCERWKKMGKGKRPWSCLPVIMAPGSREAPAICAEERAACMKAA